MKRILTALVTGCAASLGAEPLTLDAVIDSVHRKYPPLVAAEKDREAADAEITASEGAFDLNWKSRLTSNSLGYYDNVRFDSILEKPLPAWGMNVFGGYRLGRGSFPVYDEKALTLTGGELRAGFEISLWRNRPIDRRRANVEKARLTLTAVEAQKEQARIEAVRSATQRYWDWTAAGQRVAIYRELLATAQRRDEGMRERVAHGDLPQFERRDNERSILQRQAQLVSAERTVQQAAIELSLFVRDTNGDPLVLDETRLPAALLHPKNEPSSVDMDAERALKQRPEIFRLRASRDQNVVEARWADNQMSPQVDLQTAMSRDLGAGPATREGAELEASLLVSIPLERRFATGKRQSAQATADRISAQERMMRDRVVADVRDAHSAVDAALRRIDIAAAETALAKKLEEGERSRFEHGDSNILFVNLREQATADARIREVEALADYYKGIAQLQAAIADP